MNTHKQFTNSKGRIHLLSVLFLSIIFCSCTKEDSPVSIEATSKVVTTRTSQDEYFEHAKLPQIIKLEWSQLIPFPPFLNIQIRQGQGKYDQIQLGTSRDFDPNPVEYSFFPVREILAQEGSYQTIKIPVTDLQLPEGGYIAVRSTCSELVYDRPYPDKGPWNPYANFIGYDFDKQEYTFSKVNSMYGSICFNFPESNRQIECTVYITGSGYWEPIEISDYCNSSEGDPRTKYQTFSYDTKGDEVSFAYRVRYTDDYSHYPLPIQFRTISDQTSIVMITLDVPLPPNY